jgi:methylphosphotriester-DNA--protein-cysteine methyltransferase
MREEKLTPEQAQEVIREAVRLQQEQENAVDAQTLEASAAEIGVDPQHLRDAFPISLMRPLLGYPRAVERPQ